MKKIQTNNFMKLKADLIEHPPVNEEEERIIKKDKKKKIIYQLGLVVDDAGIDVE